METKSTTMEVKNPLKAYQPLPRDFLVRYGERQRRWHSGVNSIKELQKVVGKLFQLTDEEVASCYLYANWEDRLRYEVLNNKDVLRLRPNDVLWLLPKGSAGTLEFEQPPGLKGSELRVEQRSDVPFCWVSHALGVSESQSNRIKGSGNYWNGGDRAASVKDWVRETLANDPNPKVLFLRLRDNHLTAKDLRLILPVLLRAYPSLKILDLSNNKLSRDGNDPLAEYIESSSIRWINLCRNFDDDQTSICDYGDNVSFLSDCKVRRKLVFLQPGEFCAAPIGEDAKDQAVQETLLSHRLYYKFVREGGVVPEIAKKQIEE